MNEVVYVVYGVVVKANQRSVWKEHLLQYYKVNSRVFFSFSLSETPLQHRTQNLLVCCLLKGVRQSSSSLDTKSQSSLSRALLENIKKEHYTLRAPL